MYNSITIINTIITWCHHQWEVVIGLAMQRAAVRHENRESPPYLLQQPEGNLASYTSVCYSNALTPQSLGSGSAAAPRKAQDRPLRLTRLCLMLHNNVQCTCWTLCWYFGYGVLLLKQVCGKIRKRYDCLHHLHVRVYHKYPTHTWCG